MNNLLSKDLKLIKLVVAVKYKRSIIVTRNRPGNSKISDVAVLNVPTLETIGVRYPIISLC